MAASLLFPGVTFPKERYLHDRPRLRRGRIPPTRIAAKLEVSEVFGGRGLCNGEAGLRKFLSNPPPLAGDDGTPPSPSPPAAAVAAPVDEAGFDKELMGLTGGFPGGEKGLKKFVQENPPPKKVVAAPAAAAGAKPTPPQLPLLMPGMIVIVKNPSNPYYEYCGTVQRVTDGMAGVLFEGGNWDKLLSFRLDELERREKGPPMVNPKSAMLEKIVEKTGS